MDLNVQEDKEKHIRARKMMLLFSMLSIAMTFAGLTSAYIVSKSRPDWIIDFQLPSAFFISTIVIITSMDLLSTDLYQFLGAAPEQEWEWVQV